MSPWCAQGKRDIKYLNQIKPSHFERRVNLYHDELHSSLVVAKH